MSAGRDTSTLSGPGPFLSPGPGPTWLCGLSGFAACTDIQTALAGGDGAWGASCRKRSALLRRELWVFPWEDVPLCHPCSGPKRLVSPSPFFPGLFSGGFQKVRGSWRSPGSAMEPRASCSDPDGQGAARDARVCSAALLCGSPAAPGACTCAHTPAHMCTCTRLRHSATSARNRGSRQAASPSAPWCFCR